jgi:hypothetical protein
MALGKRRQFSDTFWDPKMQIVARYKDRIERLKSPVRQDAATEHVSSRQHHRA